MLDTRDVGSELAASGWEDVAPHLDTRLDVSNVTPRHLTSSPYVTVSRILAAILAAVRGGAHSAAHGHTDGLTYADGWHAAAILAELASAEAMAELLGGAIE